MRDNMCLLFKTCFLLFILIVILNGCAGRRAIMSPAVLSDVEKQICHHLDISEEAFTSMQTKPIYKFNEAEVDQYIQYLQIKEPNLRQRIQHLARKTLNQPYRIFLLGEYPFELYDSDPLYSLRESDCVVFSEHMYAMALARDWPSFFILLQRIRYKNGEISMLTRNHYTAADWDRNNAWLLEDITEELVGDKAAHDTMVIKRARFFSKYGIGQDIPDQEFTWSYIPYELLPDVIDQLLPGDFVNIVRGNESSKFVGHVGLITKSEEGQVNFLHSTYPKVKEQPLMELYDTAESYNAERWLQNAEISKKNEAAKLHNYAVESTGKGKKKKIQSLKPYFYGFKFLRLRDDPLAELRKIDGPEGPRVIIKADFE